MRPLRYSINITLDGCCDHRALAGGAEMHEHAAQNLMRADALLFGRVIYQMMEAAFRFSDDAPGTADPVDPFARAIHNAKKYVVSGTLNQVDWNAQLLRGNLREEVVKLKQIPGRGIATGGVQLPMALAEPGLIDVYEFIVHPVLAGHGPYLLGGLADQLPLNLVDSFTFASGAVAMRYVIAPSSK